MKQLCAVLLGCAFLLAADDRVKVDNDVVRILKVLDVPHHQGVMHRHEINRVMIYLDPGDITLSYEDGRKEEQHWKAGQVSWSPAGDRHTSENVGSAPIRIIEIELKKPAPAKPPVRRRELDPIVIDPAHNILLFENPQVRVFRSWREAGGAEPMHEHVGSGRALALLTDIDVKVKMPDGTVSTLQKPQGDVLWTGPVVHSAANVGPKKFEMIVVEVN